MRCCVRCAALRIADTRQRFAGPTATPRGVRAAARPVRDRNSGTNKTRRDCNALRPGSQRTRDWCQHFRVDRHVHSPEADATPQRPRKVRARATNVVLSTYCGTTKAMGGAIHCNLTSVLCSPYSGRVGGMYCRLGKAEREIADGCESWKWPNGSRQNLQSRGIGTCVDTLFIRWTARRYVHGNRRVRTLKLVPHLHLFHNGRGFHDGRCGSVRVASARGKYAPKQLVPGEIESSA